MVRSIHFKDEFQAWNQDIGFIEPIKDRLLLRIGKFFADVGVDFLLRLWSAKVNIFPYVILQFYDLPFELF